MTHPIDKFHDEPMHKFKMINDLTTSHIPDFYRWISNKSAVEYSLSAFQTERDIHWVEQYVTKIINDHSSWNQVIEIDGAAIGYCGLSNISKQNCNAEYFILIGDGRFWNKGIGTQAGIEVLRYGFNVLNLHRIWLTVSECNHRAIKSYEKIGFKLEGRMRESCFRNGRYHDKMVMGIISKESSNTLLHGS